MKILKWLSIILSALFLGVVLLGFILHEPKPQGTPSADAEELARQMMTATNKVAWDTTKFVLWNSRGNLTYLWDRSRHFVQVKWDNIEVLLHTKTMTGKVYKGNTTLSNDDKEELIQKAWKSFCNDSFWLIAPYKIYGPGTERSLITLEDGREGLMVVYNSGGITPGDAYAWILDETGLPQSWKMWVSLLPVGGLEFTWENWLTVSTGAKIAQTHKGRITGFSLKNIKAGNSLETMGFARDPFQD